MKTRSFVMVATAVGGLVWTEGAFSAGWKYGPPSDARRSCQEVSVPPGRTQHVRMARWSKAGAWFMEGQWQYECRQGAPGYAYLSVWDSGVGGINVTCYLPVPCQGPPAQFGIPRRPGLY
jgi:hypothetical protein